MNRQSTKLIFPFLAMVVFCGCVRGEETIRESTLRRAAAMELPAFWVGDIKGLAARWDRIENGTVRTIAISPGGHPIHLVAYGEREELPRRANFNSAVGSYDLSNFVDKAAREKPVVFIVGPVHGQEVEGLTGVVNLIEIMETGRDLRGRDHSELRDLARQVRLLIIPAGNPDGIARFKPRTANGMTPEELQYWGMGTWKDGTIATWPASKGLHPFKGPEIEFMGCYFNDDGINPMHDEFFDPMGPEAPAILKVATEEAPDLAVSLHSWDLAPGILRPAYVPREIQEDIRRLADRHNRMMAEQGLPHRPLFEVREEAGDPPPSFNLTSALYHVSGASVFTHETPVGAVRPDDPQIFSATFEQILDIQLTLYEAMFRHVLEKDS